MQAPWTAAWQASLSFTIFQSLPKFMSIELVMPSNHLILCHLLSPCPQSFPASGSLQMNQLFTSGGQIIGASPSASILPMNIQGWFPSRVDCFALLTVQDSQESSPAPLVESINSTTLSFLYGLTLISIHDYWKNHSFDCADGSQQGGHRWLPQLCGWVNSECELYVAYGACQVLLCED